MQRTTLSMVTMMTSSNGNIFRVTGHLCGKFTGPRWISRTKASDAELWCFFDLRMNKRLSKQPWGWWFETLAWSLWRHRNDYANLTYSVNSIILSAVESSTTGEVQSLEVLHHFYKKISTVSQMLNHRPPYRGLIEVCGQTGTKFRNWRCNVTSLNVHGSLTQPYVIRIFQKVQCQMLVLTTMQLQQHGPLTRYVKLRVAQAPGTFPLPLHRTPLSSDPGIHHGMFVTHVPWCMSGSLTRGGGGKRILHSRRMRNPQFCASGKRPMASMERKGVQYTENFYRCTSQDTEHP